MRTHTSGTRRSRRGTLLVVVLGLLVALFVIGTSFSYVTLSERRAAANYLDRQRALDLALDGVEYATARLRAESTGKHYEHLTVETAGVLENDYDPRRFALRPLDAPEPSVTWARNQSRTSTDGASVDGNWVDVDGDGSKGSGAETAWGTNLIPSGVAAGTAGFAGTVSGFHADGLSTNQIPATDVPRAQGEAFGPSGTYIELGNYFRVRAIDAASMLNLNNLLSMDKEFQRREIISVLTVLGKAIDEWIAGGTSNGEYNPFPDTVCVTIADIVENQGILPNKDVLRPAYTGLRNGEALYNLGMNFVTANSYMDNSYRDWVEINNKRPKDGNPKNLTETRLWREGYTDTSSSGRDGFPDWIPDAATRFQRAPINVNTAPKPVLVALFANMSAHGRMLYYRKQDQITSEDVLQKEKHGAITRRQDSGTTDLGRQNNYDTGGPGKEKEGLWFPSGDHNRAVFQLVPIGPITTRLGAHPDPDIKASAGARDYAVALADEVIALRKRHPFTSWQDFDSRFCQDVLLALPTDRTRMRVPDVVGAARGSLIANEGLANLVPGALLPSADNCEHPANPLKSQDSAMNEATFRAWYWKSCVDMIRAALNPNNVSSRWNPDYPYHQNVDRMDLTYSVAPICFSSMGIYEVTSQGEMLARPRTEGDRTTIASFDVTQMLPVARRQVRTAIKVYDIMRLSSQHDFNRPLDPAILLPRRATSSTPATEQTVVAHTRWDTKSYPFSIDELTIGNWVASPPGFGNSADPLEDAQALTYGSAGDSGKDRIKGHNAYGQSSRDFGYIAANPRDRTPFRETTPPQAQLNFWARFNEGLRARNKSANLNIFGVNSDAQGEDNRWGHYPWEKEALFDDFISSATPRSVVPAVAGGHLEFDNAADGEHATKYSNLRPDGVLMTGGQLRPASHRTPAALVSTFGTRGSERLVRLRVLRYPCGAQYSDNPFIPIRDARGATYPTGIDDTRQNNQTLNSPGDWQTVRRRMVGDIAPYRGHDEHNEQVQIMRQTRSNMPYYQGTVDFWIKWDLPPQGTDNSGAVPGQRQNLVVSMGEIDPASHNFSGLFGATAFGRFRDVQTMNVAASDTRNADADFEGVQFFVYKEPGGVLRFSRLYFSEAFGMRVTPGQTSSGGESPVRFGTAMRRIFDGTNPWGPYTATNDICNDVNVGGSNLGFLYARTDAWVNLWEASASGPDGTKDVILRAHDWHRFTLSYNSNTNVPYYLYIDGRRVGPVTFQDDPYGVKGFRNDGAHARENSQGLAGRDMPIPDTSATNERYEFYRTTTKLMEINPEDRLTIGCIFRRQLDNSRLSQDDWNKWYGEFPDQGNVITPPRPVFKFDSNFVAVANATIDDFRISQVPVTPGVTQIDMPALRNNSRYAGKSDKEPFYEGGFMPMFGQSGDQPFGMSVRLGTLTWTEIRPDWDPFDMRGLNLATSNRLEVEWAVVDDVTKLAIGGEDRDLLQYGVSGASGDRNTADVNSDTYWALGGLSLKGAILPSSPAISGALIFKVKFRVGDTVQVNNITAILNDISVTLLTPPRRLTFVIDY